MDFSEAQIQRYARHILLREVGGEGQARPLVSKVLVVGAGGLGSPLILYLAAAGVGTIGVVDPDVVELSNLQRQIVHSTASVGRPKVESARANRDVFLWQAVAKKGGIQVGDQVHPGLWCSTKQAFDNIAGAYAVPIAMCGDVIGNG